VPAMRLRLSAAQAMSGERDRACARRRIALTQAPYGVAREPGDACLLWFLQLAAYSAAGVCAAAAGAAGAAKPAAPKAAVTAMAAARPRVAVLRLVLSAARTPTTSAVAMCAQTLVREPLRLPRRGDRHAPPVQRVSVAAV